MKKTKILLTALLTTLSALATPAGAAGLNLGTQPLYLGGAVAPMVVIDVTKDTQLFRKLYNDYTDLDSPADGILETTYKHAIDYYGYFDSIKCYTYDTTVNRFVPKGISPASNKYCDTAPGTGRWSGNFLNWATMTRLDALRKILYGGMRQGGAGTVASPGNATGDTSTLTVLERSQITWDSHAFAKHYNGTDLDKLTPFTKTATAATGMSDVPASGTATGSNSTFTNAAVAVPISTATPKYFRNVTISVCKSDQVKVALTASPATYVVGYVSAVSAAGPNADCSPANVNLAGFTLTVDPSGLVGAGNGGNNGNNVYTITNLSSAGISLCNVSQITAQSDVDTQPPLVRVAKGNFAMWANGDIQQCQWNPGGRTFGGTGSSGNIGSLSGGPDTAVYPPGSYNWASANEPIQAVHGLPVGAVYDLVVRVEACNSTLLGNERCTGYGAGAGAVYKPTGLLQFYGERNLIKFGLFTGSYAKNKSGGVLRKAVPTGVGAIGFDEVDTATGRFVVPAAGGSIVDTLNKLRIFGFSATSGTGYAPDGCGVVTSGSGTATLNRGDADEGVCVTWGSPMSEMYLESLRYFAGKTTPDARFTYTHAGSKDAALGLLAPPAAWTDPMASDEYCAPLNLLVFNAATPTFDGIDAANVEAGQRNQLDKITDIKAAATYTGAGGWTTGVGVNEGINGGNYFVGNDGAANNNDLCTLKTGVDLGKIFGICPESPRGRGSYHIAGLAHLAHTNKIRVSPDAVAVAVPATDKRSLKVTTYGVSLAANTGRITIPVGANTVTIMPAARVRDAYLAGLVPTKDASGGLVDFKVMRQDATSGKFFVQWEVSQQGADFDLDLWGVISYTIAGNNITVTTDVISANPSGYIGFGYVIGGTDKDGAHFHSGYNTFNYTDPVAGVTGCTNCATADAPTSVTYTAGGGGANFLQDPLYYAAKYGGFQDVNGNNLPDAANLVEWDSRKMDGSDGSDGIPDNYFPISNPAQLESALNRALVYVLQVSSASSVATNSTSLTTGSRVYQARFNSNEWSGQLLSFSIDVNGVIDPVPNFDAGTKMPSATSRAIITYNPSGVAGVGLVPSGIPFQWSATSLRTDLRRDGASGIVDALTTACTADNTPAGCTDRGQIRLNYLRGDQANEGTTVTKFRSRPSTVLADIVNSTPRFVGPPAASSSLAYSDATYTTFRSTYASRTPMLYVGSNGGMLHAFEATTGTTGGTERLAYVPSQMIPFLTKLTSKSYTGAQHRYFVDGSPQIADACFGSCTAYTDWKTVAIGGYNAGGQGYYALNVTNPMDASKPAMFSEANAGSIVLWEFTDVNDPDLGFSYSKPQIVKMANGRWAAVFGNGYNSSVPDASLPTAAPSRAETQCSSGNGVGTPYGPVGCSVGLTGHAILYVLFLDGGTDGTWTVGSDYIKITTNTGTDTTTPSNSTPNVPNGLATPATLETNADGLVDAVYAGDLVGNMWKFDLSSSDPTQWRVAFGGAPFYTAVDANGVRQPITTAPTIFKNTTAGGFIILFGTGKYLENNDDSGPFPAYNSFYGIWDKLDGVTVSRSTLMVQKVLGVNNSTNKTGGITVTLGSPAVTNTVRVTSAYVPNYTASSRTNTAGTFGDADTLTTSVSPVDPTPAQRGWVLDFPNSGDTGTTHTVSPAPYLDGTGEKVAFDPLILVSLSNVDDSKVVFTTLLPSTKKCDSGGTSFIMDLNPLTGSRLVFAPFDLNNDSNFNSGDEVPGYPGVHASGLGSTIGIVPQPTVIAAAPGKEVKVLSGSSGGLMSVLENSPSSTTTARVGKRLTWRELLTD